MGTDFSFDFHRTSVLGLAEAAPADADDFMVWDLPDSLSLPTHELPDSLLLLSVGATINYEIGVWDVTAAPAAWRVVAVGTLTTGVQSVIPFAFRGARIYVRRTNVTGANTVISASHRQLGGAMSALALSPLAATAALQTTGNNSLNSIDGKVTACNTGAVTVAASALPTGAATNATLKEVLPVDKRAFVTTTLASDPHDLSATPTTGGFIVSVTGEYKLRLRDDIDADFINVYLVAGNHYAMVLSKIWMTGSPAGAKITGFVSQT